MIEKKLKTYILDGKSYQFNYEEFSRLCTNMSKAMKAGKTSTKFLMTLADELDTPTGTIKGWIYGNSGPESLDKIEQIAKCMHLSEYESLLTLMEDDVIMLENRNVQMDDRLKDAVVELYARFTDEIEKYRNSGAYTMPDYIDRNPYEIEAEMEDMCAFILKNRVYFSRAIISSLSAFYEEISCGYFESSDQVYIDWLGDRKEDGTSKTLYINECADRFYDTLDQILVEYLP